MHNVLFKEIDMYKKKKLRLRMGFLYSCLKIAISVFIAVSLLHLPHKAGTSAVVRKPMKDFKNLPTREHLSIGSIINLKIILLYFPKK